MNGVFFFTMELIKANRKGLRKDGHQLRMDNS